VGFGYGVLYFAKARPLLVDAGERMLTALPT
jgi:hypothetical protein